MRREKEGRVGRRGRLKKKIILCFPQSACMSAAACVSACVCASVSLVSIPRMLSHSGALRHNSLLQYSFPVKYDLFVRPFTAEHSCIMQFDWTCCSRRRQIDEAVSIAATASTAAAASAATVIYSCTHTQTSCSGRKSRGKGVRQANSRNQASMQTTAAAADASASEHNRATEAHTLSLSHRSCETIVIVREARVQGEVCASAARCS